MKRLRRYLVTGLLVWVPLGITILLVTFMVEITDQTLLLLPPASRPDALLGYNIPGLGAVLALVVLLGTGLFAANFLGRKLVDTWENLLKRIPLVRTVYSATKSFAEVILNDSTDSFKKVLLIEYPRKGLYSICFQTSADLGEVQERTYVPQWPELC